MVHNLPTDHWGGGLTQEGLMEWETLPKGGGDWCWNSMKGKEPFAQISKHNRRGERGQFQPPKTKKKENPCNTPSCPAQTPPKRVGKKKEATQNPLGQPGPFLGNWGEHTTAKWTNFCHDPHLAHRPYPQRKHKSFHPPLDGPAYLFPHHCEPPAEN